MEKRSSYDKGEAVRFIYTTLIWTFPREPLLCTTFVGQRTASTSHLLPRHFLKHTENVRDNASVQRATATTDARAEVKLGPCAQLSEAGS